MKEGLEKDLTKKENSLVKENRDPLTDNGKKKGKEERPATKVVVRRLPPSMTEEVFIEQVSPLPVTDYMYFVQADTSLSPHCFSRAYINFVNQEDLFIFTQKFDNYVFVDSKGLEYPAVVEFAPFQRIPKHRPNRKKDQKIGSLELDPIFIDFKEKLEAEMLENKSAANAVKQHFFETSSVTTEKKEITTPLLDFIRNRRVERQRIRDEKREEKRKKDLERRRAKDEQRKTKKDEDSPVVKPKDPKSNENENLKKKSTSTKGLPFISQTDHKKPPSCDPNLPKGTPYSVSSLQKCLLEFQKNILITTHLNKIHNKKIDLPNGDTNGIKLTNGTSLVSNNDKHEVDIVNDITLSNQNALLKSLIKENVESQSIKDIKVQKIEVCSSDIGSGDSGIATTIKQENKEQLMEVSILKNPLNSDVQSIKNGLHENIKLNVLHDDQIQIMKPLHRFAQKGLEKAPVLTEAEKEKIYSKNFCNNLNKIVETVFKKTSPVNSDIKNKEFLKNVNANVKNVTAEKETKNGISKLNRTEFQKISKLVRLKSPRPIRSFSSKMNCLSSFTLNEKSLEPCIGDNSSVISFSKSDGFVEDKARPVFTISSIFSSNPLQLNSENERGVAKVWGQGAHKYPRRPHNHTSKTYFPVSKKAKA